MVNFRVSYIRPEFLNSQARLIVSTLTLKNFAISGRGPATTRSLYYEIAASPQGLITGRPIASKGLVSRVAMAKPLAATLAAIIPS